MIGVIGCGAMGGGMIARLLETGHEVMCYDAAPEARARVASSGATVCETAAAIADRCELIILSLPRAQIVEAVMHELGPQLIAGAIVLDCSTSEPDTSKALATTAQQAGYQFVDGPVSGGPAGARAGSMTMVLGGPAHTIESIRPVLEHLTAKIVHVGPVGSGHAAKIANNLLCAANLVLVSEMAQLAKSSGISVESLLEGVNAGSGRSGVSEVNFPKWIMNESYDSGFSMGLMRKDVGLATKLAASAGLHLPATQAIVSIWEDSRALLDDSADFNEINKYEAAQND